MVNERVVEEVKDQLSRGMGLVEVKQQLLSKGWSDFDIEEAIKKAKEKKGERKDSSKKEKKKGFFQKILSAFQ